MLIALIQIFVPLILLGALIWNPGGSRGEWILRLLAFGSVLVFIWAAFRWEFSSVHLRRMLPLFLVAAAIIGFRRIHRPTSTPKRWTKVLGYVMNLVLIVFMSGMNWVLFRGYIKPDYSVELSSPLRDGSYIVLNGGASTLINAHFKLRAQGYALDLVKLNALGMRRDPFGDPTDLDSYFIFNSKVYSPCDGRVVVAKDDYQDLVPPTVDVSHPEGNHVLVDCGEVEVLLAHLKNESIRVQKGDSVTVATVLGRVGNSGNTSEPHLHLHAEKGREPATVLDGQAIPITLGDKFLVRGDIVSSKRP